MISLLKWTLSVINVSLWNQSIIVAMVNSKYIPYQNKYLKNLTYTVKFVLHGGDVPGMLRLYTIKIVFHLS